MTGWKQNIENVWNLDKKKKVETSSERKPELEWSFSILESIKRLWLSDINHVVSTEQ